MLSAKILLVFLTVTVAALAADVTGRWKSSVPGPDGQQMEIVYNFQVDGSKLTGSVTGPMGDMPIVEGKVAGDAITFTIKTDQFTINHTGKVTGNEITIKVDMGERSFESVAKKVT